VPDAQSFGRLTVAAVCYYDPRLLVQAERYIGSVAFRKQVAGGVVVPPSVTCQPQPAGVIVSASVACGNRRHRIIGRCRLRAGRRSCFKVTTAGRP
jgi:hypothetical protein